MEPNHRAHKSSCSDYHREVSSPVLRVVQVTEKGVIFESREAFEIGSWIELGFHIQPPNPNGKPASGRLPESAFISTEGMVVSSSYCAGSDGMPVHEITLLFGEMSDSDKETLLRYTRGESPKKQSVEEESFVGLN